MPIRGDLVTGTLDLLVLKSLQLGDSHGWGIMQRIRATSGDVLQVNQGSLYPAIYRLKRKGLIGSRWGTSGTIAGLATTRSPIAGVSNSRKSGRNGFDCRRP